MIIEGACIVFLLYLSLLYDLRCGRYKRLLLLRRLSEQPFQTPSRPIKLLRILELLLLYGIVTIDSRKGFILLEEKDIRDYMRLLSWLCMVKGAWVPFSFLDWY